MAPVAPGWRAISWAKVASTVGGSAVAALALAAADDDEKSEGKVGGGGGGGAARGGAFVVLVIIEGAVVAAAAAAAAAARFLSIWKERAWFFLWQLSARGAKKKTEKIAKKMLYRTGRRVPSATIRRGCCLLFLCVCCSVVVGWLKKRESWRNKNGHLLPRPPLPFALAASTLGSSPIVTLVLKSNAPTPYSISNASSATASTNLGSSRSSSITSATASGEA